MGRKNILHTSNVKRKEEKENQQRKRRKEAEQHDGKP
jgi:hypothetical protein